MHPILPPGTHQRITDGEGHWYEFTTQTTPSSCAPCCLRFIIKQATNRIVDEKVLQEMITLHQSAGLYHGSLGQGGSVESGGDHDWIDRGTGLGAVPPILARYVRNKELSTLDEAVGGFLAATPRKPVFAAVHWGHEEYHAVVILGLNRNRTTLIVIDPFFGLQKVRLDSDNDPCYRPVDLRGEVVRTGQWLSWACAVM